MAPNLGLQILEQLRENNRLENSKNGLTVKKGITTKVQQNTFPSGLYEKTHLKVS